jgi:predicted RNA-binding Zn-ribbon protein involved in translation (DUF1610 family)
MIHTVSEWCSKCESEVELKAEFKGQICPNCKKSILPCAQCENQNCGDCPLMEEKI